jgi:hypothetical protein
VELIDTSSVKIGKKSTVFACNKFLQAVS